MRRGSRAKPAAENYLTHEGSRCCADPHHELGDQARAAVPRFRPFRQGSIPARRVPSFVKGPMTLLPESTIVRLRLQALRAGFRAAELLAPGVGARAADRLWCTVPQLRRRAEPPEGGTSFQVRALDGTVRGRAWGAGPVVYLAHGWGGELAQLGAFVGPLVSSHRVVAFDGLAHGRSDPGPSGAGQSTAVELARSLEAVAARFGPAKAVVAHSLGGLSRRCWP